MLCETGCRNRVYSCFGLHASSKPETEVGIFKDLCEYAVAEFKQEAECAAALG